MLFRFFLEPQTKKYSDEFIHLKFEPDSPIRTLLEMMVTEYAAQNPKPVSKKLSDKIVPYMGTHADATTLKDIAKQFSYHPNYISTLLRRGNDFERIYFITITFPSFLLLRQKFCTKYSPPYGQSSTERTFLSYHKSLNLYR